MQQSYYSNLLSSLERDSYPQENAPLRAEGADGRARPAERGERRDRQASSALRS